MARRKDHTPEQLKTIIRGAGEKIISNKGLAGLTARSLAAAVGYAPGTIYNVYRDMDDLVLDINYATLERLQDFCHAQIAGMESGFPKIRALACAYIDFARQHSRAWETLFAPVGHGEKRRRAPKHYQQRLLEIFQFFEAALRENLHVSAAKAPMVARLLWACLHGITILTLDGRLKLVGVADPYRLIDDLLHKYLDGSSP